MSISSSTIRPEAVLPADTYSPEGTVDIGRQLSASFGPGDVLALYGDLGAGKTHLVKGICEGFGICGTQVTSPTFTIVQEYKASSNLMIYHIDAYRIQSIAEFHEFGYEEYFFGDGISIIEWADRMAEILPSDTISLALYHRGGNTRRIELISRNDE